MVTYDFNTNLSSIKMFLFWDIDSARICLFTGPITKQTQKYYGPILDCGVASIDFVQKEPCFSNTLSR
jgi:hypothetical protein